MLIYLTSPGAWVFDVSFPKEILLYFSAIMVRGSQYISRGAEVALTDVV